MGRPRGFSLVELMIVLAVLGVLGVLAIPAYQSYIRNTKITEAKATLETVRLLQEQYFADRRTYLPFDTTGASGWDTGLPGFEPGSGVKENFDIKVEAMTGAGQTIANSFISTATAKYTSLGGPYTLDFQNNRNW